MSRKTLALNAVRACVPDELDEFATHRSSKSAYWKFPRRDAAGHGGGGGITGGAGGAGGATPPPADGAGVDDPTRW